MGKIEVNNCGILDDVDLGKIQQQLSEIYYEIPEDASGDHVSEQIEILWKRGLELLGANGLPEVFFTRVRCFNMNFDIQQLGDPEEVILVGLEVAQRDSSFVCCGLVVFGRNVHYSEFYEAVFMTCLCKSSVTLFEYIVPSDSKVFEVLVESGSVSVVVTCPNVVSSFQVRTSVFMDAIDPINRFFKP